jgi:hypothetical protein
MNETRRFGAPDRDGELRPHRSPPIERIITAVSRRDIETVSSYRMANILAFFC